jgi:L-ascorbate metabolism protein UlaG (beta-lactamase superfamily)
MEVRRLAWAGLEVKAAGQTAVVDLVEDFSRLHGGNPPAEEIPPSPIPATAAAGLLTHLHSDHADVDAFCRVLASTAVVLRPERSYGSKAEVALIEKPESRLK